MAKEIERKFLVKDESFREMASRVIDITQAYLSRDQDRTVRVRVAGDEGYITVKTRNEGATRNEWEYAIPIDDAREMINACPEPILSKHRHIVMYDDLKWEVDVFDDNNLILAEVELPDENHHIDRFPPFIDREVTGDPRYYNSNINNNIDDVER